MEQSHGLDSMECQHDFARNTNYEMITQPRGYLYIHTSQLLMNLSSYGYALIHVASLCITNYQTK